MIVELIPDDEYGPVWDRFYERFRFRPGIDPATWPAILEPVPSVTWSLDPLLGDHGDHGDLDDPVLTALAGCTPPDGSLFALDWQHDSYRVWPHRAGDDGWPLSVYPNGDYYVFLAEDLSFGTFGHPWELSLCVFGAPLLDRVAEPLDRILPRVLRRDGRAG
jgi:hypothetical protein